MLPDLVEDLSMVYARGVGTMHGSELASSHSTQVGTNLPQDEICQAWDAGTNIAFADVAPSFDQAELSQANERREKARDLSISTLISPRLGMGCWQAAYPNDVQHACGKSCSISYIYSRQKCRLQA